MHQHLNGTNKIVKIDKNKTREPKILQAKINENKKAK